MGNFTASILSWIEESITKHHKMFRTHIIGSGSHIPTRTMKNADFASRVFYENYGKKLDKEGSEITEKFKEITTIAERRYADDDQLASDLGKMAAEKAIADAGIDKEKLDYIIVGHNFGDISYANRRTELVPSLSAKIKQHLGIENPFCVAYDLPFGCPGWLQGVIQADYYLRSCDAKYAIVNVAETVNVHPKLFVRVITGVPAPKPVTVCPEIAPKLLAKLDIVCAQHDVLLINICPSLFPQFGFVKVKVAAGNGFAATVVVLVNIQPFESVTLRVYVPAAKPVAVEPVPPVGDQE